MSSAGERLNAQKETQDGITSSSGKHELRIVDK